MSCVATRAVGGLHPELPGWTDQLAIAIAESRDDIWIDQSDRIVVAADPPQRQPVRWARLLTVFAATFVLGAAGVLGAHHFLRSNGESSPPPVQSPSPSAITSNSNPGYHPTLHPTIIRKADRPATASQPASPKPRVPTRIAHAKPVRAVPPAPAASSYASSYAPPAPSPAAGDAKAAMETPLVPVPETRPTTIDGWVLREVVNGTAVLEGPEGTLRVKRGDMVPGVGHVISIFGWGNRMIVATSKGLISTP